MTHGNRLRGWRAAVVLAALTLPLLAVPSSALAQAGQAHDKAFWQALAANKFALPEGASLPALLTEVSSLLASPDPELRDDIAYTALVEWIYRQRIVPVEERRRLLRDWTANLEKGIGERGTPTVFRRSFSALALGVLAILDNEAPFLEQAEFDALLTAALTYARDEQDVRGFDPGVGWMHSVAHTADLLKFLARSRYLTVPQQRTILTTLTDKLRATQTVLIDGEDERLARVVLSIAARTDFDATGFAAWVKTLAPPDRAAAPTPAQRASDQNVRHLLVSAFALLSADSRPLPSLTQARALLLGQLKGQ